MDLVRRRGAYAVVVCLTMVVLRAFYSCTSTTKPEPKEPQLNAEQKQALDDYKAELEIGRNMAGRLIAFYGLVEDEGLTNYLNQVALYVAKAGDYPDRRYMVSVIDSDSVNAFACPGGYILITRGTLLHARNEAEIAAVLGHENAHVGLQHMFNTLKKMNKDDADKLAQEAATKRKSDKYFQSRRRPKAEESEGAAMLAKYLTTASGAGLGILQAAQAGMNLILEKGLDQKFEYEADREGVKYAVRAGYDPKALDEFLAKLLEEKQKTKDKKSVMDKTHPSIPDRRKAIARALARMDASQITGAVLQKRYEEHQQLAKKKG